MNEHLPILLNRHILFVLVLIFVPWPKAWYPLTPLRVTKLGSSG